MKLRSRKPYTSVPHRRISRSASPVVGITLLGMIIALALVYLHGINTFVVSSFAMGKLEKQKVSLENDVHELESKIMQVAVGSNLEGRARALGLQEPSQLRFVHKDRMFAQATRP